MLAEVGITVDCAPILDIAQPDTTEAISCRTYGAEPMQVAALGVRCWRDWRPVGLSAS